MRKIKLLLFLIIIVVLGGCGSQKRMVSKFYMIEKPEKFDNLHISSTVNPQAYCEISPVDVYPAYASQKIANRTGAHEIVYYNFHQWAVRPGESLTRITEEYLVETNLFKGASTRLWKVAPDYTLKTTVYRYEIVHEKNMFSARVDLQFVLLNRKTNTIVVQHSAEQEQQLEKRDLNLFAEKSVEIYCEELRKFCEKIDTRLHTGK